MNEGIRETDDLGLGLRPGDPHYRAYVGPPEEYDLIAAMTFNLLTTLGLRQHHTLLDIGCGSLRAGRLFMPYLNPGKYVGIEPNQWLVEEGIRKEIGEDLVRIKRPRLLYSSSPTVLEGSGLTIDFAVAQSIFSHCGLDLIGSWLGGISSSLAPTGVLAATFLLGESDFSGGGWVYPESVAYTVQSMEKTADDLGYRFQLLDWHHPRQKWALFYRDRVDRWFQVGPLTWNARMETL